MSELMRYTKTAIANIEATLLTKLTEFCESYQSEMTEIRKENEEMKEKLNHLTEVLENWTLVVENCSSSESKLVQFLSDLQKQST